MGTESKILPLILLAMTARANAPETGAGPDPSRRATGFLMGAQEITIKALSQGRLIRINVQEGMPLKEGEVIAIVDDKQELIEVETAQVESQTAKLDYEKTRKLAQYVSGDEVTKKRNDYLKKKAILDLKNYNLDITRVVSPIDGVLTKKYFDAGETVSVGEKIFEIVQLNPLRVEMNLPALRAVALKMAQELELTTDLNPGQRFRGKVSFIGPVVDASSGTIKVRLDVENPQTASGYALRPGALAQVALP